MKMTCWSKLRVAAVEPIGQSSYHDVGATGTLALANQTTAIKSYLPSLNCKIHRYFGREAIANP